MTKKEKDNHKIIKESRITRIAKGSGTTDQAVKDFLNAFPDAKLVDVTEENDA